MHYSFPFSALPNQSFALVGRQEEHPTCKTLGVGVLVMIDWNFAHLIAAVVTTTLILLRSSNIQSGNILLPANPGPHGKIAIKTEKSFMYYSAYTVFVIVVCID